MSLPTVYDNGQITGINGNIDMNYYYGDKEETNVAKDLWSKTAELMGSGIRVSGKSIGKQPGQQDRERWIWELYQVCERHQ